MVIETIIISESVLLPMRISDFGGSHIVVTPSRKAFKKAIKGGRVLLNGKPASSSRYLHHGDTIEILSTITNTNQLVQIDIPVIYEDDHIAVVNKPAGLLTSGNQHMTLYNALPGNLTVGNSHLSLSRPVPVHRLDKAASGLLLVAKTILSQKQLYQSIVQHKIEKDI